MAGTLHSPARAPGSDDEDTPSRGHGSGVGWRRLQTIAAVVTIASLAAPMVMEGDVEGFLVAMAVPFVIGLVLARFAPRIGAMFLGFVAALLLAFSAPFTGPALAHPESAADFVPQVFFALSLVVAAVAAVPAYREVRRGDVPSAAPRWILMAGVAVAAVASVISIAAATGVENVTAQAGDELLVTRDFAFSPDKLTASAGSVSVHVTNEDSTRHTFTIDGVTDLSIPPHSTQRVTFEAAPGTYRFFCRPHLPDMDGELVVE